MTRKLAVANTAAGAVLLAAAVGFTSLQDDPAGEPSATAAPAEQPDSTVVTASGNLDAAQTVGLPFTGNPGLVTALNVEVGDTVEAGELLAEVDQRRARSQLRHARAQLRSAKARLQITTQGLTPAQRRQNDLAVAVAIQQLAIAQQAVDHARETFRRDARAQAAFVDSAGNQLDAARRNVSRSASASLSRSRNTPLDPPGPGTETESGSRSATVTANTSSSAVAGAEGGLVAAEESQASVLLRNDQTIRRLRHQATLAARDLELARSAATVAAEGPTGGELEAAKASVDDARASVQDAREALRDTKLRAPFAGTVVAIAGGVGETPVGAVRGSSSPGAGGPGAAQTRKPATRTGFVVLSDLERKSVTATVTEAEIGRVAADQPATITFPATGQQVPGTVRMIDPQETVVGNIVTYDVRISLDEPAPTLRLGQSASVRIVIGEQQPRIVPNAAVLRVGDRSVVQVRRGERLVKIPVTTTPAGPDSTEIRSTLLLPDDEVVVVVPDPPAARREDSDPEQDDR